MMAFLPIRNVNISWWIIVPSSKCEQREELCFVRFTDFEAPSGCGGASPWSVWVTGETTGAQHLHYLHHECDTDLLMISVIVLTSFNVSPALPDESKSSLMVGAR